MAIWTDPATILPAVTGIASVVYYIFVTRKQGTETEDIEQLAAYGFNYFPMPAASAWLSKVGILVPHFPRIRMKEISKQKKKSLPENTNPVGQGVLFD